MRVAQAPVDGFRSPTVAAVRRAATPRARDARQQRVLLALGVCAVVGVSVAVSAAVEVSATVRQVALFAHLAALVVGLGSVVAIDWHGLLWLLGRTRLDDVVVLSARLSAPIWLGLSGLVASGALLSADPTEPLTAVKIAVVMVLAVNGVYVVSIRQQLKASGGDPAGRLLARGLASAALSQACWWTATLIGFLNSSR
jgi:hypothetical protein